MGLFIGNLLLCHSFSAFGVMATTAKCAPDSQMTFLLHRGTSSAVAASRSSQSSASLIPGPTAFWTSCFLRF
ncbi:hypothetical protein DEU56DRAFT_331106 [Suillus clintonianus]|uniref:uncharacterized protein n=1 Tax=Suillus clintonianus TaxID=1904413 RepID=UPI001B86E254|nr:uncharacterized protein DEU56DRAFT_331106 [Suillus clintonianus]KAG2139008.1 hypothetical protein DEU56DRAFT_331106 [Suillus clintonianus]